MGAAGWYQGLDYANAFLDPDDYIRLRDGVTQGLHSIKVKFDQGAGSVTVDPDAHNGNPGIVMCRISDRAKIGGLTPVPTSTTWFAVELDTSGLSPGIHKLALRGSNADVRGVQEGVLVVPFRVLASAPTGPPVADFTASDPAAWRRPRVRQRCLDERADVVDLGLRGRESDRHRSVAGGAHYSLPGTYDIVLTAGNAAGSTTATRTVTIAEPPPLVSVFDVTPTSGVAPLTVTMTERSSGSPTGWTWDLGDGSSVVSGGTPGPHTYSSPGLYALTLIVTDGTGTSMATRTVQVEAPPPPTASFGCDAESGARHWRSRSAIPRRVAPPTGAGTSVTARRSSPAARRPPTRTRPWVATR